MHVKTIFIRVWALLALFCLLSAGFAARAAVNDPDLPGFTGNIELVPAGSLVIPMDNTLQTNNATFNLKAYGLVNALLHAACPVKWAIATGKAKDGIDFTASAAKILPSAAASSSVSFRAGPFIIHRDFTNIAMPIITGYGKTVSVYQVTADVNVDIRYTVAHMPNVGILDDGGTQGIQTNVLIEAGFPTNHFTVLHATDVAFLSTNSCYTMVCSPHYAGGANATNQAQAIRQFVLDGGNFLAQCAAVDTYENNPLYGHFQTTLGYVSNKNVSGASPFNYTNNDMAFNQYQGSISNQTGYVEEYNLKANSLFTNNFYPCIVSSTTSTNFRASVSKLVPGKAGSTLFYLGGHDYLAGDGNILNVNGRRMLLNAIFIPMDRPASCLITFQTDLGLTISSNGSITNGQNLTYTVIATNYGSGRVLGAPIAVNFSSVLSNLTWTAAVTGGAVATNAAGSGSINQNIDIPVNGSVVYTVHGILIPTATCSITNAGTIAVPNGMVDSRLTNNSAITVDRIFPAFTHPPDGAFSCLSQVPVAATNAAQFTTQGGSLAATCCPGSTTVSFVSDASNGGAGCPASPLVINRTYQITTGCGDSRQTVQTFTVIDNTAPSITCPAALTVPAASQVPAPNPALVSSSDNCSATTNRWVSDSSATNGPIVTITRTYSATDACGNSNTCAQIITVDPAFHAPTANNDSYTATEDLTLTVAASGVLGNDTDPLNLPLKAILLTPTTHGTLAFNTNGGFTYVPAANYNGPDSFTYKANNGPSDSGVATVTINVQPVNDVPVFTKGVNVVVNEDGGPQTIPNWATLISPGPADESGQTLNFIVTNNTPSLFSVQPAVSANGTLTFTPAPDSNGVITVTISLHDNGGTANGGVDASGAQTFTITINAVNDPPVFNPPTNSIPSPNGTNNGPGTVTVFEDAGPQSFAGWITGISPGPANESSQTVAFTVSNNNSGLFSVQPAIAPNGTLTFTGATNAFGSATITVFAKDNGGIANGGNDTSSTQTFTVILLPVNDVPVFTKGLDQTVNEDASAQTVAAWATGISPGPANESGQALNFIVSNNNNGLFSVQPAVSPAGTLTYSLAPNSNGLATVTIALHDDGGAANGGVDTSATQTFLITVNPVNDPPTFNPPTNSIPSPNGTNNGPGTVTVFEDAGPQSFSGWITGVSPGPANESSQTVSFIVVNNNPNIFAVKPAIAPDGTLTFTGKGDSNGTATVTVTARDNGGTANGGNDTSAPQTFTVILLPVNDVPSFTKGTDVAVNEDAGAQTINGWAANISLGPPDESGQLLNFIISNNNNGLFLAQPALSPNGALTFTSAPNSNGVATVTVTAHDNGGTANGGVDTSAPQTFLITVNPVNDPPTFNPPTNAIPSPNGTNNGPGTVTVFEDAGPQSFSGWITGISPGPANESAQTVTFIVSNDNTNLFSVQPAISTNGVLTFTGRGDSNGTANITVVAKDNAGTANGGNDTSAPQTFTIILLPVNDAPSFAKGPDLALLEDPAPQTILNWATALNRGPQDESGQALNFIVTNDNPALFLAPPAISPGGTLTFSLATNSAGFASVTVLLHDDGGTANGGVDLSAPQTFTITVTNVNDPPTFTVGPDQLVYEDIGPQVVSGFITNMSAGPPNESGQSLNFIVSNNNNGLFSQQPAIDAAGTLSYVSAPDSNGLATVTVLLHDSGGTNQGGLDTSAPQTFVINVIPVNDAPIFTKGPNITVLEDAPQTSINWATNIKPGPPNESYQSVNFILSNSNTNLFAVQPAISSTGTLTFTPAANANGTVLVSVLLHDNGGTSLLVPGGVDTSLHIKTSGQQGNSLLVPAGVDTSPPQTFSVTMTAVNDPPTFDPPTNSIPSPNGTNSGPGTVTVFEDAGPQSFAAWITGISPGPPDESAQIVTLTVSNNNSNLFSVQPAISTNGTLTFTARGDSNGIATVTLFAKDNGGTANGGNDTSPPQSFSIIVLPVNDVPSFTKGADLLVNNYDGPQTRAGWTTGLSRGPANESGQALNFIVSNDNNSIFSAQPAISPGGALTFAPSTNFGVATVSVALHDDGGTANGGVDTSGVQTFHITVNNPPIVNIAFPTNNTLYYYGGDIIITIGANDLDGTVTNVTLLAGTNILSGNVPSTNGIYIFDWPAANTLPTNYTLRAIATDNRGATNISPPATIILQTNVFTVQSDGIVADPQSGHWKESIYIYNPTVSILQSVWITFTNLVPTNTIVVNATDTNALHQPICGFNPGVQPGRWCTNTIFYAVPPGRTNPPIAQYWVRASFGPVAPVNIGSFTESHIDQVNFQLHRRVIIFFPTVTNGIYWMQYSADLVNWKTSPISTIGTGSRTQWIDEGPNATDSFPGDEKKRFYRLLLQQ